MKMVNNKTTYFPNNEMQIIIDNKSLYKKILEKSENLFVSDQHEKNVMLAASVMRYCQEKFNEYKKTIFPLDDDSVAALSKRNMAASFDLHHAVIHACLEQKDLQGGLYSLILYAQGLDLHPENNEGNGLGYILEAPRRYLMQAEEYKKNIPDKMMSEL